MPRSTPDLLTRCRGLLRARASALHARAVALRARLRESSLARGTWFMLLGLGCRSVIQAVYFIVIARSLAADGYGAFLGVVALVAVGVPFASWGTGQVLIQDVARDPGEFSRRWGSALLVTTVSGLSLCAVMLLAARLVLPAVISPWLVLTVALSELFFARLLDVSSQAFWAFGRLQRTAALSVWLGVLRLLAAVGMMWLIAEPTPEDWGVGFMLSSAVAAVTAVALVQWELGGPTFRGAAGIPKLKEGFFFSIGQSAGGIYNDIDKTMLARLATLQAAGVYGAAYRILDVAFAPVLSLLMASYTQFFKQGAAGVASALRLAHTLLPLGAAYGALTGVALYLAAPVVPLLLGEGYSETVQVIRWLSVLPLLRAVQYLGADTLTGSGRQALRSGMYVGTAGLNILLNLWLIPRYSWLGAAWASLITDGFLAVVVWAAVIRLYYLERGTAREQAVLAPSVEA